MKVRKSINIKYDISDDALINDYYSTSSHSEIIKHVFAGVLGDSTRSHIAFGPYGAGKSFISTIVVGFLSKLYSNSSDVDKFLKKFENVDSSVADYFRKIIELDTKYIPILINGYDGDFDKCLTKNLIKQVKSSTGIDLDKKSNQVFNIINIWKSNFPDAYSKFQIFLVDNLMTEEEFFVSIDEEETYRKFENFYRLVSSGASLPDLEEKELISTFEEYSKILEKNNFGVILVYDEFGRMLQNVKPELLNKFMQQLQDIAELANNQCKNLSILFIAHKPISHYFSYLEKDKRSEFAKIEKRFTITSIRSDHATFYNIASQIISESRHEQINDSNLVTQNKRLVKYRLFSQDFNSTEIENIIIKGCYPMHPVAMYLLPVISKIFGQNERTLFSFLTDSTNLGLLGHIKNSNSFYYPDYLVDYFFSTNEFDSEDHKDINIYRRNVIELSKNLQGTDLLASERLYKFIMIWNVTNSGNYVSLDNHFISYALGIDELYIVKRLEKLLELKLIRFNSIKKSWQLIESSSVNIDDEVQKRKSYINSHKDLVTITLNKYNPFKYLYSTDHNNLYQVNRFALMRISLEDYPIQSISDQNFDYLVDVFVDFVPQTNYEVYNHIFANIKVDKPKLVKTLTRLTVIDLLSSDRQFLLENKNIQTDLDYERSVCLKNLAKFYDNLVRTKYVYLGNTFDVASKTEFEHQLDLIANVIFNKTILIQNDQINMFQISKQQENPTISIIRRMIELETNILDDQFDGNKPDFLIYYSIKKAELSELKKSLVTYLDENESGKFSQLTKIATSSPYGLRPTISSLIVLYLIIDRWKDMMLFSNGFFIADVPAETIYQTGLGKKDFEYVYSKFDFGNRDFLEFLLTQFTEMSEGVRNKSLSIKVLSSLHNWFLSLPVIIQLGQQVDMMELSFIRLIQKSKTNPVESLESLVNGYTKDEIVVMKKDIESKFGVFLDGIERDLKSELSVEDWQIWAMSVDIIKRKTNRLVMCAMNHQSIIRDYALKLDILELERWPLSMFEMLKTSVRSDFQDASGTMKTVNIEINGHMKKVNDIPLSAKAENMKTNLVNLINANAKYITSSEIEKVVVDLVTKYVK